LHGEYLGGETSEEKAFALLDAFVEAGGRWPVVHPGK
jgi:hypothetical protein